MDDGNIWLIVWLYAVGWLMAYVHFVPHMPRDHVIDDIMLTAVVMLWPVTWPVVVVYALLNKPRGV